MISAQLLAYVTGTVNQKLLVGNEYLAAENRILKAYSRVGCYSQKVLTTSYTKGNGQGTMMVRELGQR